MEIGTDTGTIKDLMRWSDPAVMLRVYTHSRMDKRREAQGQMIQALGLTEETKHLIQ